MNETVVTGDAAPAALVAPMLSATNLDVGYGSVPVLRGLNLHVNAGEVVALLGSNGAGKTTTILGLAGVLTPSAGTVTWNGEAVTSPLHVRARRGLALVPEQRSVIYRLSTLKNLQLGRGSVERALELFPELRRLLSRSAGLLSGGEQQILALARALAADPSLLLADELSQGLAPLIVERLLTAIRAAADGGVGVLLVEQQVRKALRFADRAYVLQRGRIALEGRADELMRNISEIERTYLSAEIES